MERDITVQAQHLAGVLNCTVDTESRDRSDWMLCPSIFQTINYMLGPLEVDLFASRLTAQLSSFVSWRPDQEAIAMDAFTIIWTMTHNSKSGLVGSVHRVQISFLALLVRSKLPC